MKMDCKIERFTLIEYTKEVESIALNCAKLLFGSCFQMNGGKKRHISIDIC
ncbi:MAG: hypothetical protein RIT37_1543, partial [Bacteroidota bacterium]